VENGNRFGNIENVGLNLIEKSLLIVDSYNLLGKKDREDSRC